MAKLSYGAFAVTVLVLMAAILCRLFVAKVPPEKIGVRMQQFAILGEKGIQPHDYSEPGWYRSIWFIDTWRYFEKRVQTMRLLLPVGSPIKGEEGPALQIKSHDGYDVRMNLRIKYRIKLGEAHKLLAKLGHDESNYRRVVVNEAMDAARIEFGEMRTEDFYDPVKRSHSAGEVHKRLQTKLDERHIEVIDILISEIGFDDQYEQKIKSKKLADQDVEVSKSKSFAARYKGETLVVKAQTDAKMKEIKAQEDLAVAELRGINQVQVTEVLEDANAFSVKRRSDAELLLQKSRAEVELLVKTAEADGERARVQAMSGSGGRTMVALEAARNLKIEKVDFSTLGVDVFDVEAMAHRLGMR